MSEESTIVRTGASFNRAESKQDYATPWELIHAVQRRFGAITHDLAASKENRKADRFFDESANSLVQNWRELTGNLWLNPPFANISPWAEKCAAESAGGAKVFFLTPASVGSNWFERHVHGKAYVLFLSPRIQFVGAKDPYPKDCIVSCFFHGLHGFDTWKWK